MILIADSGATKTDWMTMSGQDTKKIQTEGINPFHQTREKMEDTIVNGLVPQLEGCCKENSGKENCSRSDFRKEDVEEIYFYGAGCLPEPSAPIREILEATFTNARVEIYTDLMGAARALCKDEAGIVCILGTGSNSCYYDGTQIVSNVSPLGYILGDEGSGAYLGKRFIGDCLKGQLPEHLKDGLLKEYSLTVADILNRVYRQPQANRFLASVTPYIYKHKAEPETRAFLKDCFREFFRRNLSAYDTSQKVSFTGSIAWYFREEIEEAAHEFGLITGTFLKEPIYGLQEYHSGKHSTI